jgi:hypothetical protein
VRDSSKLNHLIPLIKAWGHNKKMGLAKKGKNEKQTKKTRKNEGDK